MRGGGEHRRQDQRVAVQRGQRVVVVELEALDEAGVQQGRGGGAGSFTVPADKRAVPGGVERSYSFDANAGNGQLRTDEGTADAVKYQVLSPVAHGGGDVVERRVGH